MPTRGLKRPLHGVVRSALGFTVALGAWALWGGAAVLAQAPSIPADQLNDRLADRDGRLYPDMTGDGLHPTVTGYQVWADALRPILAELIGPPAPDDHAPPATGDHPRPLVPVRWGRTV